MTSQLLKRAVLAACAVFAVSANAAGTWNQVGADVFTLPNGYYRSQGMAADGSNFWFSWQYGLEKTDLNYNEQLLNGSISLATGHVTSGIPTTLSAQGYDHIGDIDVAGGILYASLHNSRTTPSYSQPAIALYDASTLQYTGRFFTLNPPDGTHDIASWVAVDAAHGLAYGMAYNNATEMAVYNLSDFSFVQYVQLSQTLNSVQGGKLFDGWMYMSADDSTRSVYRTNVLTGEVQTLFSVAQPYDQEVEGLTVTAGADGQAVVNVLVINDPLNTGSALDENVTLYHFTTLATPVPEPASVVLMLGGLGLLGLGARRRRGR